MVVAGYSKTLTMTKVAQKLRSRLHARHEQMVARSCAGDVEQMALRVVDLLEVGFVGHGLDALLQRHYFVVAGHDDHCAKLKALAQVHGADGDLPTLHFGLIAE
ncbi:MAG: hypothetical protein HW416_3332 [Chloroflexi bacterium]|nr:hypothetical protein [Chloroflexota bacterium]